jgi:hypothetical protein
MPGPAPTRTAPATLRPRISLGEVRSLRYRLPDGHRTTVHVATYPRAEVTLRLVELEPPQPLASWCTRSGVADALVAGFFVTPDGPALGEVWIGGRRRPSRPMDPRWAPLRGCLAVDDGTVAMAPRHALPAVPRGDLLQAGPLLVAGGRVLVREGDDPEGFSATRGQFDSDVAAGRHPRAAVGIAGGSLVAIASEGRSAHEAGLTLAELAVLARALGCEYALNLDGGGSTSLVVGGLLRNTPREASGAEIPGGRAVVTALALVPRAAEERGAAGDPRGLLGASPPTGSTVGGVPGDRTAQPVAAAAPPA